VPPDTRFIVYGAPDPKKSTFLEQWSENSVANIGNYTAFMLLDVQTGRPLVIDAAQVESARSHCSPFEHEKNPASSLLGAGAFATGGASPSAPPLLGIVTGGSVDLLELHAAPVVPTTVTATCRRSLISLEPITLWAVTDDDRRLLGSSIMSFASWDLPPASRPRSHRLASPESLRRAACQRGLAQVMASFDATAWRDLTHLSSQPAGLCDGPSARGPASPSASPSPH